MLELFAMMVLPRLALALSLSLSFFFCSLSLSLSLCPSLSLYLSLCLSLSLSLYLSFLLSFYSLHVLLCPSPTSGIFTVWGLGRSSLYVSMRLFFPGMFLVNLVAMSTKPSRPW